MVGEAYTCIRVHKSGMLAGRRFLDILLSWVGIGTWRSKRRGLSTDLLFRRRRDSVDFPAG